MIPEFKLSRTPNSIPNLFVTPLSLSDIIRFVYSSFYKVALP